MINQTLAPVLLFAYKRLDTLQQTVSALRENDLANETDLFIFSDAAKAKKDEPVISEVRAYLKTLKGFKCVKIFEALNNKGLAASIIEGVTQVIKDHGKVIVLEDDLVPSLNFLKYMNQSLDYYKDNSMIFSISGFSFIIKGLGEQDVYFTQRASSWGWATWEDRWHDIDWDVKDYDIFRQDIQQRRAFNRMGSDMSGMLDRQMKGKMDSWAIRWCYHQFKHQLFTVYPAISKVRNIGFVNGATHTKDLPSRYATNLDASSNSVFNFSDTVKLAPEIIRQFTAHYSIRNRIKYKIINSFYNAFNKQLWS